MNKWLIAGVGVLVFAGLLLWRLHAPMSEPVHMPRAPQSRAATGDSVATPPPATTDAPAAEAESVPVDPLTLTDKTSAQAMMLSLFMQLEQPMREWAATRGMPQTDANGNFILDQPYQQYDDETLAALANNGDMWAQQILAERLARARPAEAMELYRKAAAQGSIFAMLQIAELADNIAAMSPDFEFENEFEGADNLALDQYYSLRDTPVPSRVTAFAWKAVAEMAGLPGFLSLTGSSLPDEDRAAACDLAGSIYSDMLARRARLGLGPYPGDPPPAWFDPGEQPAGSGCEHSEAVQYDFSACRQIRYAPPGKETEDGYDTAIYVCDDG